ncbi:MAG: TatD family hydrolase [Nanoarchaeota archaeon]|nr:TatD family hydrolase [Nanoarchaeota archaeon]
MEFIDCHTHLDSERYDGGVDEVVERARKAGAVVIITSGVNPSTNRKVLELSRKYDIVKCSFGLYPVDSIASQITDDKITDDVLRYIEKFDVDLELKWIEDNVDSCVAIGEIGLDYKIIPGTEELQKVVFVKALRLAKKLDKPVVIHSRKAEEDAIEIMEEEGMKNVMMHCFSGKKRLVRRCVENGWFLSVPAVITRLDHFKMLVEITPLENLVTETDAPYLSPVAGTINESSNIPITIKEIARIKGLSEEEVAGVMFNNAKGLFGL